MGFPFPFLAGLAVLLLHDQIVTRLPGQASFAQLAMIAPIVVVPWALAAGLAMRRADRAPALAEVRA